MQEQGIFIEIDGCDGAGKTYQAERLVRRLRHSGLAVCATREPSDGPIGRMIRRSLTGEEHIASEAMGALFAADREHHVATEIRPALARGEVVVTDRYAWSNRAYRGAEVKGWLFRCRGAPSFARSHGCGGWQGDFPAAGGVCPMCNHTVEASPEVEGRLAWTRFLTPDILRPTVSLILVLPAEVAAKRRAARGGRLERYEQAAFQARVCSLYANADLLAAHDETVILIDATGEHDDVAARVWAAVGPLLAHG